MNATIDIAAGETLIVLSLAVALVAVLAELSARCRPSPAWQRGAWQAAILACAAILAGELTGFSSGASAIYAGLVSPATAARETGIEMAPADAQPFASLPAIEPDAAILVAGALAVDLATQTEDSFAPLPATAPAESSPMVWDFRRWLLPAAIAGALALLTRLLAGRWLLSRMASRWEPLADESLQESAKQIAARLGLRRPLRLLVAGNLAGPVAFGVWRPTVGLPRGFCRDFNPRERRAMLAHEVAHLAGRDPAWHALADLFAACLWWHPAAWWLRARWQAACEAAADEASLLFEDGPEALASCLVALAKRATRRPAPAWLGIEGRGFRSGLGRRVVRLVALAGRSWRPPARSRGRMLQWFGAIALSAAALFSTAWARPQAASSGESSMNALSSSWRKSLAGAVVLAALTPVASAKAQDAERKEGDRPAPQRREGDRDSPEARAEGRLRPEGERDRPREAGPDRRAIQEKIERLSAAMNSAATGEVAERIEKQLQELRSQLARLNRDGDAPRREGQDRPAGDRGQEGRPDAPRRPDGPPTPPRIVPGGPGAPPEMMNLLREMRAEMQRLREEVGQLRARVNELSGGPRGEGDRPQTRIDADRPRPERGPDANRRPPEGERRDGDRPEPRRPDAPRPQRPEGGDQPK